MSNQEDNIAELERSLASLTAGPTGEATLWKRAMEKQESRSAAQANGLRSTKIGTPWLVAASITILVVLGASMLPTFGTARSMSRPLHGGANEMASRSSVAAMVPDDGDRERVQAKLRASQIAELEQSNKNLMDGLRDLRVGHDLEHSQSVGAGTQHTLQSSVAPLADRFVIRKATLDLSTVEVRGAFSKVGLVINDSVGEYVETSSLTGEGTSAFATITLRVASNRMSEVLSQLRVLGTVVSEASTGQDVTDQIVDLDARIRNEQRIEKELLAIIDKRPDAPLKDLLEIRSQLDTIRNLIESLMGQRERVGRQVSLATVLVTIRAQNAPAKPVEQQQGIGGYFTSAVSDSWTSALRLLSDTAAFFIRVIVGGIVWWTLGVFVFIAFWRAMRHALGLRATEPVPVG